MKIYRINGIQQQLTLNSLYGGWEIVLKHSGKSPIPVRALPQWIDSKKAIRIFTDGLPVLAFRSNLHNSSITVRHRVFAGSPSFQDMVFFIKLFQLAIGGGKKGVGTLVSTLLRM